MKSARYIWPGVAILLAGLAALAVFWLWSPQEPAARIAGPGEALPRAEAEAEFILVEALDAVRAQAARMELRALVVHRHGHRVFEYFAPGGNGTAQVDGGELAIAVLQLALPEPELPPGDEAVAALVSERIWLPLRAGDAWLSGGAGAPRQCCIRAQLDDWVRAGDLLLGQGAYRGERIVSADAVRQLLAAHSPAASQGDEPLLARDGTAFDLTAGVRLWLAPRRGLAILVWGKPAQARNTLLPNLILRGLNDAAPAIGGGISDIVPGH
ncbi:MAG: hypothetical protein M3Y79_06185 [Pseudomonadota bacterium]|nr:hypothetical protein [Pseudomonadota bacterium]